jgi:hypothetical protein
MIGVAIAHVANSVNACRFKAETLRHRNIAPNPCTTILLFHGRNASKQTRIYPGVLSRCSGRLMSVSLAQQTAAIATKKQKAGLSARLPRNPRLDRTQYRAVTAAGVQLNL